MANSEEISKPRSDSDVAELVNTFADDDGVKRRKARLAIEEIGKPAVASLINALSDKRPQVRWEAARALGAIQDPQAAPALVTALSDVSFEIRWLAAEGLIALEEEALVPLLKALGNEPESVDLRAGAHHVLHALERSKKLNESTLKVLNAIRSMEPDIALPGAAYDALQTLKNQK
jgi:HEAT repeat protein